MEKHNETEFIVTDEEIVEIAKMHFAPQLRHHSANIRGNVFYNAKDGVMRFAFTSKEGEIPE